MINPAGFTVAPTTSSVVSALNDYVAAGSQSISYDALALGTPTFSVIQPSRCSSRPIHTWSVVCVAGSGRYTWPLATFGSFIYRQSAMQDCAKAAALAEFLYWSQTSSAAEQIASRFCKLLDRHSD